MNKIHTVYYEIANEVNNRIPKIIRSLQPQLVDKLLAEMHVHGSARVIVKGILS